MPTPVTFEPGGNRIAEYDEATGSLIREYIWLGLEPLAVVEGGQVYFVRSDHIGRPVFATDVLGLTVWEAAYLPFGGVHVTSGTPIDLRFPGQWYQAESGLHQNWMRDYDPTTGRYLQADPLGLVDGASVYGYAGQYPAGWIDPTGQAETRNGARCKSSRHMDTHQGTSMPNSWKWREFRCVFLIDFKSWNS